MNQVREQFCSLYDAWAGPSEVRGSIDGIDLSVTNSGDIPPSWKTLQFRSDFQDLIKVTAAWHNDENFRSPLDNIVPLNAN